MMWGARRRVLGAVVVAATFAVPAYAPAAPPATPPAAAGVAAQPLACDSVAVSPAFATDRTALCLYVGEDLPLPMQPPTRQVVVRLTRDGGRTWRDATARGLNADGGACAPRDVGLPGVCRIPTHSLQAVFSASFASDKTAYVSLSDSGLWQTTDLGETFVPVDRLASSTCCSAYWLEPFRRPGTEGSPLPESPLAQTDGGSSCGTSLLGTAEILPPLHRPLMSPTTWPLRFVAPPAAYGESPVFLAGHSCSGTFPDWKTTSQLYGCDLRLACGTKPLHDFKARIDDVIAGGDHAKQGTLYATATAFRGGYFRVGLHRSLKGGRSWHTVRALDAAIPAGDVDVSLAAVPRSSLLYAWAHVYKNGATQHVLLRSADHGARWTRIAVSGPSGMPWAGAGRLRYTGYYEPSHLVAAPGGTLFFLGTAPTLREERFGDADVHRLWCSTDGGRTWAAFCR